MTLKDDYCQSIPKVFINIPDEHVSVWWNVKNMDGDVYPIELQMSMNGTLDLISHLEKAVNMLRYEILKKRDS